MNNQRSVFRRILRLAFWLIATILLLFALQVTVLAFPQMVLHQCTEVGAVGCQVRAINLINRKFKSNDYENNYPASLIRDTTAPVGS